VTTPRLDTERLVLRPFTLDDAPVVQREVARIEMARMLLSIPHPYPADGALDWIASTQAGTNFALELRDRGDVVGAASLVREEEHRRAEVGYWCALQHWGRGYTTEAVRALVDYGFRERALNRIFAQVFSDNAPSRRVLEKAGMTYEGARRQHVFRLDRYVDTQQFGILRSEWRG
jgi:ribosomal-protein-alanine N-acetyltransferase